MGFSIIVFDFEKRDIRSAWATGWHVAGTWLIKTVEQQTNNSGLTDSG